MAQFAKSAKERGTQSIAPNQTAPLPNFCQLEDLLDLTPATQATHPMEMFIKTYE